MEPTAPTQAATTSRQLLRHAVATVAYRGGKALRGAPENFAKFKAGEQSRTPEQILAHMGDLYDWALTCAKGKQAWHDSTPLPWTQEVQRWFKALQAFDDYLASDSPLGFPAEKILQGAVADSLSHVGQILMLRRLAGCPIRSENYFRADIVAGRVGEQQTAARQEF
ncbi:MAG TPA: hypothetical protein VKY85_13205 [Candidatus Angelobacter sp.]|nr:hypothetical protein [Candidatus Angelobacter sp.]